MSKPVDLELKKAFLELQVKMIETSTKIHEIDTEKWALTRLLDQVKLNSLGMASVQEGTKTYEAVGRMFLKRDVEKLRKRFEDRRAELVKLIQDLNDNKEYPEKNLKESEDNIREMEKWALTRLLDQVKLNSLGMASVQEGTKTYEAVGRMFLKRDVEKLRKRFEDRRAELVKLIQDLNDNKEYLEKNLKESEDNIREMVQLRIEQSEIKAM